MNIIEDMSNFQQLRQRRNMSIISNRAVENEPAAGYVGKGASRIEAPTGTKKNVKRVTRFLKEAKGWVTDKIKREPALEPHRIDESYAPVYLEYVDGMPEVFDGMPEVERRDSSTQDSIASSRQASIDEELAHTRQRSATKFKPLPEIPRGIGQFQSAGYLRFLAERSLKQKAEEAEEAEAIAKDAEVARVFAEASLEDVEEFKEGVLKDGLTKGRER